MSASSDVISEPSERAHRNAAQPGGKVAAIVFSALEKNPYYGIVFGIAQRIGNIPPPAPGEPWMFALGDPGALEDVYKRAGFLNVPVHTVAIQRRFPSAADAIRNMQNSVGDTRELMNQLSEAQRESAYVEIQEQLSRFEGPSGLEVPGEVLIGVGTK